MEQLIKAELKKTLKRRDSVTMFILAFWPALVTGLTKLGSGLFDFHGEAMGAFEFTNILLLFQDMIFLPVLVMVYIASVSIYQEISNKQIFFYKDINRRNILVSKYISIYFVYIIFLVVYLVNCFVFYYLLFRGESIATGTFLADKENVIPLLYESFQVVLGILFYVHIGITLAIRYSTGFSIFGTTLIYMVMKIAPSMKFVKYIIPMGYREVLEFGGNDMIISLILSIVIWSIYNVVLFIVNKRKFYRLEY